MPPPSAAPAPSLERFRRRAALASLGLYVLACATPAVATYDTVNREYNLLFGAELLLIGCLGVFAFNYGWFANLFLAGSGFALLMRKDRTALVLGVLAILVGLDTLYWYEKPMLATSRANQVETGELQLRYPSIGFFLWMASMFVLVIAVLVLRQRSRAPASGPAGFIAGPPGVAGRSDPRAAGEE
ncbi:hypothetical protein ATI61_103110 [Archangium gephyra]|uniref:Uncharacterized protein n=1 Tax=Archangium gephyra TaxID=48 RepID=A0ABX9K5W1_9BACT|nr:hypothetical protein [Archangium gephyra]REG34217.1 hypothetical protein ATI61_103110 [Archangium gephyra]